MHRSARRFAFTGFAAAWTLLTSATPAHALQPLETFLAAAKTGNADNRIATAVADQRSAESDRTFGTLLPSLNVRGVFTHNSSDTSIPTKYLNGNLKDTTTTEVVASNQGDGYFTLTVPIIQVGTWERNSAGKSLAEAAAADALTTTNDVAKQVTRGYYQLLAQEAVLRSAKRNFDVAQQNVAITKAKKTGGTASTLDIQRGNSNVALAQQDLASATLQVATGRRSLETLTGVAPEPAAQFPTDDLHEEAPLPQWMGDSEKLPAVISAKANQEAADSNAAAATADWIPTVSANAQGRVTNAPGFALNPLFYTLQVVASWQLDATLPANVRAQHAAATAATVRAEKVKRAADDQIFADWHQVRASIDRARAARAQLAASTGAADLTRDRYGSGMQTELEVLQSQEDAFRADVARIQADADLAYARSALRIDSAAMAAEKTE